MAGASCHRCGETLREPLRHLEGKVWKLQVGMGLTDTLQCIVFLFWVFVLASCGVFVGGDPNSCRLKQIHEYSHSHFYAFYLYVFETKKSNGLAGFKLRPLQPVL